MSDSNTVRKRKGSWLGRICNAVIPLSGIFVLLVSCSTINYTKFIKKEEVRVKKDKDKARDSLDERPPLSSYDINASYIKITSDSWGSASDKNDYDRKELVTSIEAAWGSSSKQGNKHTRIAVSANVNSNASVLWAAVFNGLFLGVPILLTPLGIPVVCSSAEAKVLYQSDAGEYFQGKGDGTGCSGLYYPGKHYQKAVASAINDSFKHMRRLQGEEIEVILSETFLEDSNTAAPITPLYLGTPTITWKPIRTQNFPVAWGAIETQTQQESVQETQTRKINQRYKVAVMDFEDQTGALTKNLLEGAVEYLRSELVATNSFVVISKDRQRKAMVKKEKKESWKECYDQQCRIELGQALSSDYIVTGVISKFGKTFTLTIELIDLAKEATIQGAKAKFDGSENGLERAIEDCAKQIAQ